MRKTECKEKRSGGVYSIPTARAENTTGAAGCEAIATTGKAEADMSGFALTKFCRFCVSQPAAGAFVGWQQWCAVSAKRASGQE